MGIVAEIRVAIHLSVRREVDGKQAQAAFEHVPHGNAHCGHVPETMVVALKCGAVTGAAKEAGGFV